MSQGRVPELRLRYRYYRYMAKLEKEVNVKVGFALFAAGLAAAALALVVLLFAVSRSSGSAYLTWAEPGYALALLALPLVLLGTIVLLPPDRRLILAGGAGLLICLGATAGFVWVYPDWQRFGATETTYVMVTYAAGAALLALGMAASMREHAPELIETVTQIHVPDPDDAGAEDDGASSGSTGGAASTGASADGGGTRAVGAADADADGSDAAEDLPAETAIVDDGPDVEETAVIDDAVGDGRAGTGEGPIRLVVNGRRYTFGDGDTFGRQDKPWLDDLIVAADGHEEIPYVSGDHLEFSIEDDGVYVTDVSRNGTKLNGRDVSGERARITDGDTLILADRAKIGVEL